MSANRNYRVALAREVPACQLSGYSRETPAVAAVKGNQVRNRDKPVSSGPWERT